VKLKFVFVENLIYYSPQIFKMSGYSPFNQITLNFFTTFYVSIST